MPPVRPDDPGASRPPGDPETQRPRPAGGPLFRLYLRNEPGRTTLAGAAPRAFAVAALAWLPLAALSLFAPSVAGVSFFADLEVHLKLLVALPVLILGDLVAQARLAGAMAQFTERALVKDADRPRFEAAVAATLRLRDSLALELVVLFVAVTLGHWIWRERIALGAASWYALPGPDGSRLTPGGIWYAFASVPIFRFVLFLWYAKLVVWFCFLFRAARLDLRLAPGHPDRAGGIGFVGNSVYAFVPFLVAQGALLAGILGNRIAHEGRALASFKVDVAGLVLLELALVCAPMLVFAPRLGRVRRRGLRDYGGLASRYVREFEAKWLDGGAQAGEPLLGSADLQSLADLDGGFAVAREMRVVPIGASTVLRMTLAVLAPLLPLALTVFPLEELIDRVVLMLI